MNQFTPDVQTSPQQQLTAAQVISEARAFLSGFEGCDINGATVAPILAALRTMPDDILVLRPGRAAARSSPLTSDDAGGSARAFWYRREDGGFRLVNYAVDHLGNDWRRSCTAVMDDFGDLVEVQP